MYPDDLSPVLLGKRPGRSSRPSLIAQVASASCDPRGHEKAHNEG